MSQIRITPEELRESATFLGQKEEAIGTEVQALKQRINDTTANWEGAAQNSFVQSFENLLPMLEQQLPEVIKGIMSMLNGAANTLEEADQQISSAFNG